MMPARAAFRRIAALTALVLATTLAGCMPFALKTGTPRFAAADHTAAISDGTYGVVRGPDGKGSHDGSGTATSDDAMVFANEPDGVRVRAVENGQAEGEMLGRLIPLGQPGIFLLQMSDAVTFKTGERETDVMYLPMRVEGDELVGFLGPADPDGPCAALLVRYGFNKDKDGEWNAPAAEMDRDTLLAFYREVASILADVRDPRTWQAMHWRRLRG